VLAQLAPIYQRYVLAVAPPPAAALQSRSQAFLK
jgi:hypothetical protein